MLDGYILMLVHPSSGDNIFYKVRDGNHIVLIDSFNSSLKFDIKAKQFYAASQRVL